MFGVPLSLRIVRSSSATYTFVHFSEHSVDIWQSCLTFRLGSAFPNTSVVYLDACCTTFHGSGCFMMTLCVFGVLLPLRSGRTSPHGKDSFLYFSERLASLFNILCGLCVKVRAPAGQRFPAYERCGFHGLRVSFMSRCPSELSTFPQPKSLFRFCEKLTQTSY